MHKIILISVLFFLFLKDFYAQPIIIRKFHFIKTDLMIAQGEQENNLTGADSSLLFIRSNNDYRYKNLNGNVLYENVHSNLDQNDLNVSLNIDQLEAKGRLIYYIFGFNYYYVGLSAQRHSIIESFKEHGEGVSSSRLDFTYLMPGFGAQVSRALFGFYFGFGQQKYLIDTPTRVNKRPLSQVYDGNLYHLEFDSGGRVFGDFFNRVQFYSSGFSGGGGGTVTTFTNDRLTVSLGYFIDKNNRIYLEYENRKIQSVIQKIGVESYIHNSTRVYYRFLQKYGVGLFLSNEDITRKFTGSLFAGALINETKTPSQAGIFLQFFLNNI